MAGLAERVGNKLRDGPRYLFFCCLGMMTCASKDLVQVVRTIRPGAARWCVQRHAGDAYAWCWLGLWDWLWLFMRDVLLALTPAPSGVCVDIDGGIGGKATGCDCSDVVEYGAWLVMSRCLWLTAIVEVGLGPSVSCWTVDSIFEDWLGKCGLVTGRRDLWDQWVRLCGGEGPDFALCVWTAYKYREFVWAGEVFNSWDLCIWWIRSQNLRS